MKKYISSILSCFLFSCYVHDTETIDVSHTSEGITYPTPKIGAVIDVWDDGADYPRPSLVSGIIIGADCTSLIGPCVFAITVDYQPGQSCPQKGGCAPKLFDQPVYPCEKIDQTGQFVQVSPLECWTPK